MHQITEIKPQVKNKSRCSIYLDGKFFCGLDIAATLKSGLKAGQYITKEQLSLLQLESDKAYALDKAFNYLSISAKTQSQIVKYLQRLGFVDAICQYVLEKLQYYGYIDDASYAKKYAVEKSTSKGKYLIKQELARKGASQTDIQNALDGLGDQTQAAINLAQKYLRNKPQTRESALKAYRHLLSKGFDYDTSSRAVKSLNQNGDDEEF